MHLDGVNLNPGSIFLLATLLCFLIILLAQWLKMCYVVSLETFLKWYENNLEKGNCDFGQIYTFYLQHIFFTTSVLQTFSLKLCSVPLSKLTFNSGLITKTIYQMEYETLQVLFVLWCVH